MKVDIHKVLDAFKRQGYFTTFEGHRIYKNDFRGVYVAGSTGPLTWDFANLTQHRDLQLKDPDGDGIYTSISGTRTGTAPSTRITNARCAAFGSTAKGKER